MLDILKYKKRIFLAGIIGIIGITLVVFCSFPEIISYIENNRLEHEVLDIKNSLQKENKNDLENMLSSKIFVFSKNDVEDEVEKYLKGLIDISYGVSSIENNKLYKSILSCENIKDDENINKSLEYIKSSLESLNKYKEIGEELLTKDNKYIDNKEIEKYLEAINKDIEIMSNYQEALNCLNNYKDQYELNNKITFLKKSAYLEYREIVSKFIDKDFELSEYEIIKDDTVPVIYPTNLEINVGSSSSLKDIIKCIDEIDGEVECNITGEYNLDVVGNYNVSVEARDSSSNYTKKNVIVLVKEKIIGPYYTEIIRNHNTIVVYGLDENNQYTKIVKVFACSTGRGGRTPTGTFYTTKGAKWGPLMGNVWGQYYTVITKNILFHSVPYYTMSKENLEWEEYNKLGTAASAGCVRLTVSDAKWIYDNCPSGMRVRIYDGDLPNGVEKPTTIKIDSSSPYKGWDPTDPDLRNPWNN